jgi:hypothetical protein
MSDLIAIYAAIVATGLLVVEIRRLHRERPSLKVEASHAVHESGHGEDGSGGEFIELLVTNTGPTQIYITEAGLELARGDPITVPIDTGFLASGDRRAAFVAVADVRRELLRRDPEATLVAIYVRHTTGTKTYRLKPYEREYLLR